MSSALLYLAIVLIWACVLVPRWLRRDSAIEKAAVGSPVETGYLDGEEDPAGEELPAAREHERPASRDDEGDQPAVWRPNPDQSHRRVLSARRRLLSILTALAVAAYCLAGAGLAAWWVVLPPTVMLAGYLLLLREAARTDAERALRTERPERRERSEHPERAASAEAAAAGRGQMREGPRAPVPPPPNAEVIEISAQVGEHFYDQYTDDRLRAVGD